MGLVGLISVLPNDPSIIPSVLLLQPNVNPRVVASSSITDLLTLLKHYNFSRDRFCSLFI